MKYITVEARTYEDAVRKARETYGPKIRVHSRKDVTHGGVFGLGKQTTCEITCFLTDEVPASVAKPAEAAAEVPVQAVREPEEPKAEQPGLFGEDQEVSQELLDSALNLLEENDFSRDYRLWMNEKITQLLKRALPDVPTLADVRLSMADMIASSIDTDRRTQNTIPSLSVIMGMPSSGKTSCAAKLAAINPHNSVGFISTDPQNSAWPQAEKLSKALGIDAARALNADELEKALASFKDRNYTVVDFANTPESTEMIKVLNSARAKFFAVIPATMKNSDIDVFFGKYSDVQFKGIIVSKTDETSTAGNIISVCRDRKIPFVFISDGKKIPKDFKKATPVMLLEKLKGFSVNFSSITGEMK